MYAFWRQTVGQTDRRTNEQMDRPNALNHLRYRERWLNNNVKLRPLTMSGLRPLKPLKLNCAMHKFASGACRFRDFFEIFSVHPRLHDVYSEVCVFNVVFFGGLSRILL